MKEQGVSEIRRVHFKNIRLFINAGMDIPECKAGAKLLDCDSGRWPMTGDKAQVTCKNCLKRMAA